MAMSESHYMEDPVQKFSSATLVEVVEGMQLDEQITSNKYYAETLLRKRHVKPRSLININNAQGVIMLSQMYVPPSSLYFCSME